MWKFQNYGVKTVANTASAKKRNRQNVQRRTRNRARKAVLKTQTRKLNDEIRSDDLASAETSLSQLQKTLGKMSANHTLHKNTAARRKSRLARTLNRAKASAK